jgi:hypothetical protein
MIFDKYFYIYGILFSIALLLSVRINYDKKKSFREELKLYWGDSCFHLHHWITYSLFIGLILVGKYISSFYMNCIIALLFGIICEDFLYGDVFKLREKC